MTKNDDRPAVDQDLIIDRIYEIALEPSLLEDFIDFWHDADLDKQLSEDGAAAVEPYQAHLERAQVFLQRTEPAQADWAHFLEPYGSLAAFVVGGSLSVQAANQGALSAFGVKAGDRLGKIGLPYEMGEALVQTAQQVLHRPENPEKLLKAELASKDGSVLFRLVRIGENLEDGPAVLVVSTHYHWRETIDGILESMFGLTGAEQNVVRLLVEGEDAKSIAGIRQTTEGTVRGQIKSIVAKMNVRSQTDIIRLAMSLGEFPAGTRGQAAEKALAMPALSNDWIESEVWKPFASIDLADGRALTYHEIGPAVGNPILFSHMGSCMVRWPRSMIRLIFEHNLRVICPIRAGYGHSDNLDVNADVFASVLDDTVTLLSRLGIARLPYAVQGSDFPFGADLMAKRPDLVSELIGVGGRPCLPGGAAVEGSGSWQRFFVSAARNAPNLVQFASKAVMAMTMRVGPEAMLRKLCKDSPADLALLENEEMLEILAANISLMAGKSTNAASAFAMEYIAFYADWSDRMVANKDRPIRVFLADQDPTIDLNGLPLLQKAYPWIEFEVIANTGLALMFQAHERLIGVMADAAKACRAGEGAS